MFNYVRESNVVMRCRHLYRLPDRQTARQCLLLIQICAWTCHCWCDPTSLDGALSSLERFVSIRNLWALFKPISDRDRSLKNLKWRSESQCMHLNAYYMWTLYNSIPYVFSAVRTKGNEIFQNKRWTFLQYACVKGWDELRFHAVLFRRST